MCRGRELKGTIRLANAGDALAQFNLGVMYANGYGVPQDYKEALKWYKLSAGKDIPMHNSTWCVILQRNWSASRS